MTKILFICTANKDRSPTAAAVYRDHPELEVKSAGTWKYATTPLTENLIQWADALIVMEPAHEIHIREQYPASVEKRMYCLHIQDEHRFMSQALIHVIKERMGPFLAAL